MPGPLEQAVADAPAVLAVDLREIVDVEQQQGERVLVPERALDLLRQRELEHRRGDERRQRVAQRRGFRAGDLLGVRAEDLEGGAADRVGDEGPRLRRGAEPIVERDFVEHALRLVDRVEELALVSGGERHDIFLIPPGRSSICWPRQPAREAR